MLIRKIDDFNRELKHFASKSLLIAMVDLSVLGNFHKSINVTKDDYKLLFKLIKDYTIINDYKDDCLSATKSHFERAKIEEAKELYWRLLRLQEECYKQGLLHTYNPLTIKYIKLKTSLLPLVLANKLDDTIKMTGPNGYLFLCNFHLEKNPSFHIYDSNNSYFCHGCGFSGNIIDYVRRVENLSYKNAVDLIMKIFLLKEQDSNDKLKNLIEHYQSSIISDSYQDLLEMGIKRIKKYNIDFMPDRTELINEYYQHRFEMIERIKQGKLDNNFTLYEPDNQIALSIDLYKEETFTKAKQKKLKREKNICTLDDDLPF